MMQKQGTLENGGQQDEKWRHTVGFGSEAKLVNPERAAERRKGHEKVIKPLCAGCEEHHEERQESASIDKKYNLKINQIQKNSECMMCDEWNCKRSTVKAMKKHVYTTRVEPEESGSCWTERREGSRCRTDHAYDDTERTRGSEEQHENVNPGITQHMHDSEAAVLNMDEEREYWRPSYMFKWLRAIGEDITNASEAFEQYKGKESYKEMGLEPPIPLEQDMEHVDEWSHMSDYDEMGSSPTDSIAADVIGQATPQHTIDKSRRQDHREDSRIRMTDVYDGIEDARECEWKNGESVSVVKKLEAKAQQIKKQLGAMAGTEQWHASAEALTRRAPKRGGRYEDDEDSDGGECEKLVCNMTGHTWEALPFPVVADSGASASVMPQEWCPHVPTIQTPQSEQGEYCRAANGNKIFNQGQKMVTMVTQEGAQRDIKFTVCDVSKALASGSQMCRVGNSVVFNPPWSPEGSYIQHVDIGERLWLREGNGLYMLDTRVAPMAKQTSNIRSQGFTWPVSCSDPANFRAYSQFPVSAIELP